MQTRRQLDTEMDGKTEDSGTNFASDSLIDYARKDESSRPPDRMKQAIGVKSLFRTWGHKKRHEFTQDQSENTPSAANAVRSPQRRQRVPSFSMKRGNSEVSSLPIIEPTSLELLTEDELNDLTMSNTRKNSHRNLKARLARAQQTLQALTTSMEIEALPLVKPDNAVEGKKCLPESTGTPKEDDVVRTKETNLEDRDMSQTFLIESAFNKDGSMDFEPASFTDLSMDCSSRGSRSRQSKTRGNGSNPLSNKGLSRPSVRISTSVSVVSATDLTRNGREAVQRIDLDEHPSRNSAKALKSIKSSDGKLLVKLQTSDAE